MSQILHPVYGAVMNIYKGSRQFDKVYKGTDLVWSRNAAGAPTITSFTASAPSNGFVTLTFQVSANSTHNVITHNGQNVPLTTDTTAVIADPGVGSYDYVLTCSNAAGAVSRTVTVTKNAQPTLTNLGVRYVVPTGTQSSTNAYFSAEWAGWPRPTFEIDYGEGGGFTAINSRHISGTTGGTIRNVVHTYAPGQNLTARMKLTNSAGTVTKNVTVRT